MVEKPETEQTLDEKLNKLASEIGENPDAFEEDAWMELFDASMTKAEQQRESMSDEELEMFTAKDLAGFETVKKRLENPTEKEMTLERLLEKSMEIEAALDRELKTETEAKKRQPFRWKKRKRTFLLAAVVIVLGLGATMVAQGDRVYELRQYPMLGTKNVMVNHNSVIRSDRNGDLYDAYKQIKTSVDFEIFKLDYILPEMNFKKVIVDSDSATIEFELHGKAVYFKQRRLPETKEIVDSLISDRTKAIPVHNEWLDMDIEIEKNILENDLIEYSAKFCENDVSCYLAGIMEEEAFIDLVKGIHK